MNKKALIIAMMIICFFVGAIIIIQKISFPDFKFSQVNPVEHVTVSLKWLHQGQFAGIYYAQESGYYKNEGLDVELKQFDYTNFPIDEVVNGDVQFGVTGADELLLARAQGKPVVALAAIYQNTPVCAFSLAESNIVKPVDLIGKRLGLQTGVNVEYLIRALLENQGIDTQSDLQIVDTQFDLSPIINGELDAMTGYQINEPLTLREMGYQVNIINPVDYGIDIYADVLFTTENIIKNNPELVGKFVSQTVLGWEDALKNKEQSVEYTLKYKMFDNDDYQLEYNHEINLLTASEPLVKPNRGLNIGEMSYVKWKEVYELLRQSGLLVQELDISKAFTHQFIR